MSDFLNQFTKENYDPETMKISKNNENYEKSESHKDPALLLEKKQDPETGNNGERKHIREEVTELDPEYKKKHQRKLILISLFATALVFLAGFAYYVNSYTTMPNFVGLHRQEASAWAKKYDILLIFEEDFNLEFDEDFILSQEIFAEEKVKKGSNLKMQVSLGADPDQLILIPDFKTMNGSEIQAWLTDNKMRFVQVDYQYSNDVEADTFISFEIKDKDVTSDNFLRKNKGLILVSKGKETFEKDILVLDFKNKTKDDIETWNKEKEFINKFTYEEEYNDEIPQDGVISQSIAFGEKVSKDEILTFKISKGKAIKVPDYASSELNTFDTINSNGAMVMSKEIFTMSYPYGAFVEQSIAAGTVLNDSPDVNVIVYYSLGKPYIQDLVGQSEGQLPAFFYEFKGRGANITYKVIKVKDCETKGTVVRASKNNEFVSTSDHVDVYISDGSGLCDISIPEGDE